MFSLALGAVDKTFLGGILNFWNFYSQKIQHEESLASLMAPENIVVKA